jgi:thiamine biosynthesis protein ThiS
MKLTINGMQENLNVNTVDEMLLHFKLDQKKVVVELNKSIVKRDLFSTTHLSENDSVEIVTIVGGG